MKIREYVEKYHLKGEIEDICTYGCIEGTCCGLTYYYETEKFYDEHKEEIWDIISNLADEMGDNPLALLGSQYGAKNVYDEMALKNFLVWFVVEEVACKIVEEEELKEWKRKTLELLQGCSI